MTTIETPLEVWKKKEAARKANLAACEAARKADLAAWMAEPVAPVQVSRPAPTGCTECGDDVPTIAGPDGRRICHSCRHDA